MPNQETTTPSRWTILELLRWTQDFFKSHGIDDPRISAELLLAHVLGIERIALYVRYDQPMDREELSRFKSLIRRRAAREPVAYILGKKAFWNSDLQVDRNVLIPRPETECLVENALELLQTMGKGCRVLDLGTGSGAIAIALAQERADLEIFAVDRFPGALSVCRNNARALGMGERIKLFGGSWFAPLHAGAKFHLMVSNPPYIPSGQLHGLAPEIRHYEPMTALDGGKDGLSDIRRLIADAPVYLKTGGALLMEIGYDQGPSVQALLQADERYEAVELKKDYSGIDRVAVARRK